MDVVLEVKKLNFPPGEFVVVGSGIMSVLGLKEAKDIDIVVSEELFKQCKDSEEWEVVSWTYPDKTGSVYLQQGLVEVYLDVNCGNFNPATEELIGGSKLVQGVPFITLETLLKFKREYNRPKDRKDIEIIENYLMNKGSENS